MRDIKFRGYNGNLEKFIYGSLLIEDSKHDPRPARYYINDNKEWRIVIPQTVGQYTGLKDSEGNEIYEGDVLVSKNYGKKYFDKVEYIGN